MRWNCGMCSTRWHDRTCRYCCSKGGTGLHFVSRPHLRDRCDTDLLLPSREAAECAGHVLQTLAYQQPIAVPGDLVHHELGCYKTDSSGLTHALDVHWRLGNATLFAKHFTFAELAAAARAIPALGPTLGVSVRSMR